MDDEINFSFTDLINQKVNLLDVYIDGFFESVEICLESYNVGYRAKDDHSYNLIIGDNLENYNEYVSNFDNSEFEENIVGLGVLNPILFLKLLDNEETIKKLLKFEKVVINCGSIDVTVKP